jgi:hypothetical protein
MFALVGHESTNFRISVIGRHLRKPWFLLFRSDPSDYFAVTGTAVTTRFPAVSVA